ncbi:GNAT family N-acetyltransferase [uncultured Sphingomonas sp.]|uniref:GNAT family N-acetyltransferase n=1 Tax=uncultured Sphingomonas sp. TaxID=158754 RepID=UPI0035CAC118
MEDDAERLELILSIHGARTLRPVPGVDLGIDKIVMRAGAELKRFRGLQLSNGFNVVDPSTWRRQGIGTVAMNRMIEWAQRRHPDAPVKPVELKRYGRDVLPDEHRLAFYRRFGLTWDAADQKASDVNWCSREMKVCELRRAELPACLEPL